ncbi:hypothetical protein AAWM_09836 [Aspergillus awamori]|uniref:F-box domain-containing protein n=1 Tax=Aspergillus awamori TaxID=105351 RepID=A0A401L5V3_ASPAW|nr:hypothetical protein AAWM_09836 [Aspergillus awamori]GKZ59220.1 hypothetical protein AnigIFM49718_005083 [Aspergillus niger]
MTSVTELAAIDEVIPEVSTTDGPNLSAESQSLSADHSNPANLWGILLADSSKHSGLSGSILTDDTKLSDFSESILTDDSTLSDLPESPTTNSSNFSDLPESQFTKDTCHSDSHIHLETLPAELRVQILDILDLEGLEALVRASPVYHDQYLLDRKRLLFACLKITLGNMFIDACAVQVTSSLSFRRARSMDTISSFVQSLRKKRAPPPDATQIKAFTLNDTIDMVTFYRFVLKPFARHYSEWALSNLAKEPETSHAKINEPPSITEEHRIIRALYRFQLFCNLLGTGPHKHMDKIDIFEPWLKFESHEVLMMLESLYEPWELEEINCVNVFAQIKGLEVLKSVTWDFHETNPKFADQNRPPTPQGAFDIKTNRGQPMIDYEDSYLIGLITQGLDHLQKIFFEIQDHSRLVAIMEESLILRTSMFICASGLGALDYLTQDDRRIVAPSERDKREERREPLPFRGDKVDESDGAYPPLAWTLLWKGTYSNMFGNYIPNEIPMWGYVMWDAARLERTGAKEVLLRQFVSSFWDEDQDPRDQREFL